MDCNCCRQLLQGTVSMVALAATRRRLGPSTAAALEVESSRCKSAHECILVQGSWGRAPPASVCICLRLLQRRYSAPARCGGRRLNPPTPRGQLTCLTGTSNLRPLLPGGLKPNAKARARRGYSELPPTSPHVAPLSVTCPRIANSNKSEFNPLKPLPPPQWRGGSSPSCWPPC